MLFYLFLNNEFYPLKEVKCKFRRSLYVFEKSYIFDFSNHCCLHAIVIPLQADSEVSYRIGVFVAKVLLPVLFFYLAFKKEKNKE